MSNETAVGAGNWSKGCVCKGPRERVVEADERSWHRMSRAGAHKGAEGGRDILDESGRDGCAGRHKERRRTPFVPSLFPLVFPPPPPFLSVIVLSVVVVVIVILVASVVVVVDARTFAMIGVPSGGVGVGALVERDATAVETVERTERDSDWCRRGVEGMRVHEAEGTSEGLRRTSGSWRVTKLTKWSRACDAKLSPSLTQVCPRANLNLRPLALASTLCTPANHFFRPLGLMHTRPLGHNKPFNRSLKRPCRCRTCASRSRTESRRLHATRSSAHRRGE